MPGSELSLERDLDLPPVIVWDALVDPDLLAGWLGEVVVEPRVGGRFDVLWLDGSGAVTPGRIVEFEAPRRIVVHTEGRGLVDFSLEARAGGTRGEATLLRLSVRLTVDAPFAARIRTWWDGALDRAEAVLRGHPVDWSAERTILRAAAHGDREEPA